MKCLELGTFELEETLKPYYDAEVKKIRDFLGDSFKGSDYIYAIDALRGISAVRIFDIVTRADSNMYFGPSFIQRDIMPTQYIKDVLTNLTRFEL